MFKKTNMNRIKKKAMTPMPIFQTQNQPVPVIRNDVEPAFTLQQSKKLLRSSGLEK